MLKVLKIPKLIRWIFVVGIIFLLWMGLLRLIFYFVFNHAGNPISVLGPSFLLGLRYDIKMICLMVKRIVRHINLVRYWSFCWSQ